MAFMVSQRAVMKVQCTLVPPTFLDRAPEAGHAPVSGMCGSPKAHRAGSGLKLLALLAAELKAGRLHIHVQVLLRLGSCTAHWVKSSETQLLSEVGERWRLPCSTSPFVVPVNMFLEG